MTPEGEKRALTPEEKARLDRMKKAKRRAHGELGRMYRSELQRLVAKHLKELEGEA